ncbi:MAG TPA: YibE/F family protein [Acidimicrobiia bacterium]|nr:YibE/F family protein [Acidimicrobiia bacterium]
MPRRTRRVLGTIAAVLAVATVVGMLVIGFGTDAQVDDAAVFLVDDVYEAEVIATERVGCQGTSGPDADQCLVVTLRLTQGPDEGAERTLEFPESSRTSPDLGVGDRVVLNHHPDGDEGLDYSFADRQRRRPLLALLVLFAVAVVLLGRVRGFAALAGLAVSVVVILTFVLPGLLDGHEPVLVAVIGASAIAYLALYLAHGVNPLTTVALLGTLAALALTVGLSMLFTELTELSGFASEEAAFLGLLAENIDMRGLVLAGIVIGALGALDDMTVTQASAVAELSAADPTMSRRQLYAAGLRIGRDHVASTVNTLALAYAGAALPVLLLFVLSAQSLGTIANSEIVATEIVRTLVGSIGLVAAVPITTWLAALIVGGASLDTDADDNAAIRSERRRVRRPRRTGPPAADERPAGDPGDADDFDFWR